MRILVIEDDNDTAAYLVKGLKETGYTVDRAADGREGLFLATSEKYDAMIVDRMLPGMEGLAIVQSLRAQGNVTPVLILSALGQVDDRVRGLQAGGDDYLTKPYAFSELLARLQALLRRRQAGPTETTLKVGDLELDLLARTAKRGGKPIDLLPREFRLLEYMMRRKEQMLTRAMLLEEVWNYKFVPQTNLVDVHMGRLRRKVDEPTDPPMISARPEPNGMPRV